MFKFGFPELVIFFAIVLFLFRPRSLFSLSRFRRETLLALLAENRTFFTLLAILLVLFILAEFWITCCL
jgi:hypothetical protein